MSSFHDSVSEKGRATHIIKESRRAETLESKSHKHKATGWSILTQVLRNLVEKNSINNQANRRCQPLFELPIYLKMALWSNQSS